MSMPSCNTGRTSAPPEAAATCTKNRARSQAKITLPTTCTRPMTALMTRRETKWSPVRAEVPKLGGSFIAPSDLRATITPLSNVRLAEHDGPVEDINRRSRQTPKNPVDHRWGNTPRHGPTTTQNSRRHLARSVSKPFMYSPGRATKGKPDSHPSAQDELPYGDIYGTRTPEDTPQVQSSY